MKLEQFMSSGHLEVFSKPVAGVGWWDGEVVGWEVMGRL